MAWNPNVPTVTNRVQDDLDAIRENFQHLDQLAERVDELQTVSELAPIANDLQAVSGLASVAGELQAVSELAPYIQAILGSRIVDHNLDVPNPPNGYYVRWENGLQACWIAQLAADNVRNANHISGIWDFPATFANTNYDAKATRLGGLGSASGFKVKDIWVEGALTTRVNVSISSDGQFVSDDFYYVKMHAIGMWK